VTIFANYEGYVSQSNVSNETTSHLAIQLLLCFPKTCAIKSIPSWTITQIVQDVVLAT